MVTSGSGFGHHWRRSQLLLSCRYGDLGDVKLFIDRFGAAAVDSARDENENTALHMASANGHTELLDLLLPLVSPSLLSAQNSAGSTALHWAALNCQLHTARALVNFPGGPGVDLIDIKNASGRSPLGEAELAAWEEGSKWMVEVMRLDDVGSVEDNSLATESAADVQVEIQDADGQIARMSITATGGSGGGTSDVAPS
ncbi:ankyrin repeat-containing domain protein [Gloeopeniophorella convolvens]|nr:ankyrin repeat-containing domain protein [Gloeopeniophorella convolvens]